LSAPFAGSALLVKTVSLTSTYEAEAFTRSQGLPYLAYALLPYFTSALLMQAFLTGAFLRPAETCPQQWGRVCSLARLGQQILLAPTHARHRPNRRRYRDIPWSRVTCLFNCDPAYRGKLLDEAIWNAEFRPTVGNRFSR
jgi:hypothetical protein